MALHKKLRYWWNYDCVSQMTDSANPSTRSWDMSLYIIICENFDLLVMLKEKLGNLQHYKNMSSWDHESQGMDKIWLSALWHE